MNKKRKDAKNAKAIFKSLKPTVYKSKIKTGTMVVFKYNAKNKEMIYDKTPCSIILWRTRYYTLGLNLHWVPLRMREIIVKEIFKLNKNNIKNGKGLDVSYAQLKPFLRKINALKVVRLYINNRMSSKGLIVPDELMLAAAKYSNSDFSVPSPEKLFNSKK